MDTRRVYGRCGRRSKRLLPPQGLDSSLDRPDLKPDIDNNHGHVEQSLYNQSQIIDTRAFLE